MNTMDVALICKALGDSNRLQIVQMLSEGEKCGCKLLEAFKITQRYTRRVIHYSINSFSSYENINRVWFGKCT